MPDFRVRFVGDLGNLAQFNSAISSALSSNQSILSQANSSVASRALGGALINPAGSRTEGFQIRNGLAEIDRYNNALIQSGQVVRQFIAGYRAEINSLGNYQATPIFGEAYHTDFRLAIHNLAEYERLLAGLGPVDTLIRQKQFNAASSISAKQNAAEEIRRFEAIQRSAAYTAAEKDAALGTLRTNLDRAVPGVSTILGLPTSQTAFQDYENASAIYETEMEKWRRLGKNMGVPQPTMPVKPTIDPRSLRLGFAEITNQVEAEDLKARSEIQRIANAPLVLQYKAAVLKAAVTPSSFLNKDEATVLDKYPLIQKDLIRKAGLGGGNTPGTGAFYKAAADQEFKVTNISRDMDRNLTRVSGSLRDANGLMNEFSYTIKANGEVINTWGRQLSGARGVLGNTGRDILKFTEWMLAATVVMGAFGAVTGIFTTINTLNSELTRFGITARLTGEETEQMFKGLSDVAFNTATPIEELVKAADDMALATRRANQSTEEWHASILELANAVGILTNISGLDTVRATELLVAAMKQLDLTTSDLVPLLNQITAAAGGQSGSITDIATALGGLAEAAQEAGISVTQQIAAVQVISQVTGKSADQVATAFKNLFGSIAADASIKKLAEFDIAVRDVNGNLRPFLEIYRDIQDAITKGVIPEGRINEVIRAIAGGPRRAPDASALLNNIYKVFEVEKIAVGASNEALIANAKILDTNNAKIVQLQNVFKADVFERLNDTIQKLVSTLVDLGTIASKVFGTIPSEVYAIIVQMGSLLLMARLLSKAFSFFSNSQVFAGLGNATQIAVAATGAKVPVPLTTPIRVAPTPGPTQAYSYIGPNLPPRSTSVILSADEQRRLLAQRKDTLLAPPPTPLLSRGVDTSRINTATPRLFRDARGRFVSRETFTIIDEQKFADPITKARLSAQAMEQGFGIAAKEANGLGRVIGTFRAFLGSRVGKFSIGAGAAIGAGALAASKGGEGGFTTAGNIAQIAGLGLSLNPATLPIGLALTGGSLILQHLGEEADKASERILNLEKSLYDVGQQYKQDTANVNATAEAFTNIQNALKGVKEGTQEYVDLQRSLGEAALAASEALNAQKTTIGEMGKILQQLSDSGTQWAQILSGGITPESLAGGDYTKIVQKLSEDILAASGQIIFNPEKIGFDASKLNYGPQPKGTIGTGASSLFEPTAPSYDFLDLLNNPSKVKDFIGKLGTEVNFPVNQLTVSAYGGALQAVKGEIGSEKFAQAVAEFGAYVEGFGQKSAGAEIQGALTGASARQQALSLLGGLSGDELINAQSRESAASRLFDIFNKTPETIINRRTRREVVNPARERLGNLIQNTRFTGPNGENLNLAKISAEDARKIADEAFKNTKSASDASKSLYEELASNPDKLAGAYSAFWKNMGVEIEGVTDKAADFSLVITEAAEKAITGLQEFSASVGQDVANRVADLRAQLLSGEIDSSEYAKATEELHKFLATAQKVSDLFIKGEQQPGFEQALASVKSVLADIPGLENAASLSTEELIAKVFQLGDQFGLSGDELVELASKLINFYNLVQQLKDVYIKIPILLTPEFAGAGLQEAINKLKAAGEEKGGGLIYQSTINQLQALLNAFKAAGSGINTTLSKGSGSPVGTVPKPSGGSSASVGTIYLTDEQKRQANVLEFVKKSVADAFKLQAQIPGEAAKNKNDIVAIFNGLEKIYQTRGVSEELLRKALEENTAQLAQLNTKADTIQRIRVGAGTFAAFADVPLNRQSGVSVGTPQGPITVNLNINGQLITPAQFDQLANKIGAVIKNELANG